jgi:hypothetical protein
VASTLEPWVFSTTCEHIKVYSYEYPIVNATCESLRKFAVGPNLVKNTASRFEPFAATNTCPETNGNLRASVSLLGIADFDPSAISHATVSSQQDARRR